MQNEEYNRLVNRMNEVRREADSAMLFVKYGDEVDVSTFGEPAKIHKLGDWIYKWLGGIKK